MKRIREAVTNNRGSASVFAAVVALCLLFALVAASEYFRLLLITQGVRDAVQSAVIATVNDNYDDVYHGVREGYAGAYQPRADEFEESIDYGDVYRRLDILLGLDRSGQYHVELTGDGRVGYKLSELRIEVRNAPLAASSDNNRFEADCYIRLELPVLFVGRLLPPLVMNIKTSAGYTPLF